MRHSLFVGSTALILLFTLIQSYHVHDPWILLAQAITTAHVIFGWYILLVVITEQPRCTSLLLTAAYLTLCAATFLMNELPAWYYALAIFMLLAVIVYLRILLTSTEPIIKSYARAKLIWETPAIAYFIVAGLLSGYCCLFDFAIVTCVATTCFAVYMILIRRMYFHLVQALRMSE